MKHKRIEEGIADWRATGSMLVVPYWLALKAEVLHLADRTSEALEAITEAEALVVRTEERWWCAELLRNTADKRRAGQEDTDFDYLFGDCSQRAVSRFGCRKSSVIKQTLEMQSEDISATAIR
jgi:predicted ATPase